MERSDVIILGGGLVGLALAAALDASGLSVIVIDPADPDTRTGAGFDGRATALSSSSQRMFDTVGISEHFPEAGAPIRRIEVTDGLAAGGLAFDPGADDDQFAFDREPGLGDDRLDVAVALERLELLAAVNLHPVLGERIVKEAPNLLAEGAR